MPVELNGRKSVRKGCQSTKTQKSDATQYSRPADVHKQKISEASGNEFPARLAAPHEARYQL